MGLREILTTPMGFGSSRFCWREPASYRIRLRGDVWLRLGVVLGAWGFGVGVFGALFANNVHRPGPILAAGLGSLFGLMAAMMVFFLRDHVSGRIHVEGEEIRRHRSYAGLTPGGWHEWQYWPYAAIDSCTIVPASAIGKSFSVLALTLADQREIVGVPRSVDLFKLAKFLTAQGVRVTQGKSIPQPYARKLDASVAGVVPVLGLLVLIGGMSWLLSARQGVAGNRPERGPAWQEIAERERRQETAPRPEGQADRPVPGQDATVPPVPSAPPQGVPNPAFGGPRFGFGGPRVPAQAPPEGIFDTSPPNGAAGGFEAAQRESGGTGAIFPKTEMVGAPGGFDFTRTHLGHRPVVGFRSTFGSWAGSEWIGRLEPLYSGESPEPNWKSVISDVVNVPALRGSLGPSRSSHSSHGVAAGRSF